MDEVPGYEVPLHRSLTRPVTIAGVPRPVAITIGTIAGALAFGLQVWWAGAMVAGLFFPAARYLTKKDADFFAILTRHLRHKSYLGV